MNILIDLEPSESFPDNEVIEGVNNLRIQFDKQVTNKVSDTDLSNQQESEQTPETRDCVTEVDLLEGYLCYNGHFF